MRAGLNLLASGAPEGRMGIGDWGSSYCAPHGDMGNAHIAMGIRLGESQWGLPLGLQGQVPRVARIRPINKSVNPKCEKVNCDTA